MGEAGTRQRPMCRGRAARCGARQQQQRQNCHAVPWKCRAATRASACLPARPPAARMAAAQPRALVPCQPTSLITFLVIDRATSSARYRRPSTAALVSRWYRCSPAAAPPLPLPPPSSSSLSLSSLLSPPACAVCCCCCCCSPLACSIAASSPAKAESEGPSSVMAAPACPARPVRPTRCTYLQPQEQRATVPGCVRSGRCRGAWSVSQPVPEVGLQAPRGALRGTLTVHGAAHKPIPCPPLPARDASSYCACHGP